MTLAIAVGFLFVEWGFAVPGLSLREESELVPDWDLRPIRPARPKFPPANSRRLLSFDVKVNRVPAAVRTVVSLVVMGAGLLVGPAAADASQEPSPSCSRVWIDREADVERLLATGEVAKMEAVPIGVTKPQRGTFAPGSLVSRFVWKALPPQHRGGYMESYKAEIAAYHLDRLLEMHMVPPVVERTIDGKIGAAVLWIEKTTPWDMTKPIRGPEPEWSRQVRRMKLFDQLIGNIDRNQGNLLYDADWHLFLIDHSRAFTTRTSLDGIAAVNTVDRGLWQRIEALTADSLERALGAWLTADERRAILARRDRMRQAINRLLKTRGAAGVILD